MTEWRFSRQKLTALERRLVEIDEEQNALDISGPRANLLKFANAADRDRHQTLTIEWGRTKDEADMCALALWRRERRRSS